MSQTGRVHSKRIKGCIGFIFRMYFCGSSFPEQKIKSGEVAPCDLRREAETGRKKHHQYESKLIGIKLVSVRQKIPFGAALFGRLASVVCRGAPPCCVPSAWPSFRQLQTPAEQRGLGTITAHLQRHT